MSEMLLDTKTLPEALLRMLRAEKVRVRELDGGVLLTPIMQAQGGCPLLGIASDCGFTVDEFLARKRDEKVLEGE
jgi:hypothetical protein